MALFKQVWFSCAEPLNPLTSIPMRKIVLFCSVGLVLLIAAPRFTSRAADNRSFQTFEYATIRWGGRDNTHLIRPNGTVEILGPILSRTPRPDRADDRSFYMSLAMNAVAKEGYEVAGMTADDVVMKRPVQR